MKNNFDNPNILIIPEAIAAANLNLEQFSILLYMAGQCSICDYNGALGGQTTDDTITYYLEKEEGYKVSTIKTTLKKLENSNIIKHHKNKGLYQINPNAVWIPSSADNPTAHDQDSFEQLKHSF